MKFNTEIQPCFEPVWQPAQDALGKDPGPIMYMAGYILEDGTIIHTYKHKDTRRYLNLSDDGRAWVYVGDGYNEAERQQCIDALLLPKAAFLVKIPKRVIIW